MSYEYYSLDDIQSFLLLQALLSFLLHDTNRSIEETLDLGWLLLSVLPKNTLDRIDNAVVDKFYDHEKAVKEFNLHEDVVIKELKDAVTNG